MSEPLSRPLACVQHDWPVDVEAGHGAFWVSVARQHGKIAVDKSGALAGDSPAFSASLASNKVGVTKPAGVLAM